MSDNHTRRELLGAAGAAGVVSLAGCSGLGGGGSGDTIMLGGTMSLSGDNADLGKLYQDAYNLTIDRINENGGVEAGDGNTYELELDLRDDQTDASASKTTYQELIQRQDIDYLVGPYSSTVTLPASAVAAQNEKPMVEGGGASPEIFSKGNEWIFGLLPTANKYALSSIDMAMAQSSPPESAAILAEDDTFSQSTAGGVRTKMNDAGLDIVVDESFPTDTSDLSTNLGKVRDQDADILILCAHQKHAIIMANQMENQDVNVDMAMATVGSLNDAFKDEAGPSGDYVYGPSSWDINADFEDTVYGSTSGFADAVSGEFDYTPDYHSAAGETVILTFKQAFEQVDELTPTNVRDAIRRIEFTSAYGNIAFGDSGVIDKEMLVYQWQPEAGKQLVYPENVQQSEPTYPTPTWSER
ncbi:branched-chain amino acid ABC transporter substrate-binding protein [Halobacteriales archaeon SW_8_65_20]|nr:MAG: branched-chain amino acid ABC transporter substrate-binding protein [Halobacteriales archaeon SW_8_65_20]